MPIGDETKPACLVINRAMNSARKTPVNTPAHTFTVAAKICGLKDPASIDAAVGGGARYIGLNFFPPSPRAVTPDRWLDDGDEVTVGNLKFDVRHCPGHTPGHIVFFQADQKLAMVGDVLFKGSVGRTDLPRGDHDQLLRSIRRRLWPLGDDVTFVPGHGPLSTFGAERQSNPYVSDLAGGPGLTED